MTQPTSIKIILEEIKSGNNVHKVILDGMNKQEVQLGRIDEHLKTLNGSVNRHDRELCALHKDNDKQWKFMNEMMAEFKEFRGYVKAKLVMTGVGSGGAVIVVAKLAGLI